MVCVLFFAQCNHKANLIQIQGEAQGTSYNIRYFSTDNINYKDEIYLLSCPRVVLPNEY